LHCPPRLIGTISIESFLIKVFWRSYSFTKQTDAQVKKVVDCGKADFTVGKLFYFGFKVWNFKLKFIWKSLDKCCANPVGDIVASDVLSACFEKSTNKKLAYSWVNDYMLNKLQIAKLGNTIDITDKNNRKYK